MNLEKWITEKILEKTQYQGNTEAGIKAISASDFGNDILQIWLRYKYGVPEKTEIGQDTLGTVVHFGMEQILKDEAETEVSMELEMPNGWKLTGMADIVLQDAICDIKVTKSYTIERVEKEPDHQYVWQLNVYRYLYEKLHDKEMSMYLIAFLKDGGYDFRKMENKPSLKVIQIPLVSNDEIEKKFYEITSQIEQFETLGIEPPQCKDLWFRKVRGKSIPVRCMQYCAYSDKCKYFNPKHTTTMEMW